MGSREWQGTFAAYSATSWDGQWDEMTIVCLAFPFPLPQANGLFGLDEEEEDEEEVERQEMFEAEYNFRFQEPGGASIVSHPR